MKHGNIEDVYINTKTFFAKQRIREDAIETEDGSCLNKKRYRYDGRNI